MTISPGLPSAPGHGRAPALVLAALLLLAGCAPRSYVVLIPSPDGSVGEVVVSGKGGDQLLTRAGQAANIDGSMREKPVGQAQIDKDFGAAIAARPMLPVRFLLYFTSGKALSSASQKLIPDIVDEANARTVADLSIVGHTDTVYTTEYNDMLALARARHVADLLTEKGLKANSVSIQSHGQRNLLVPTPDNTYEPRNRRVEVSVR